MAAPAETGGTAEQVRPLARWCALQRLRLPLPQSRSRLHGASLTRCVLLQYEILGWYQSAYAFKAETEAELDLNVGDIVAVYAMDGDWWEGELADGRCGLFPGNHVVEWVEETDLNGTTGGDTASYGQSTGGALPNHSSTSAIMDGKTSSSKPASPAFGATAAPAASRSNGKGKPKGGAGEVVAKKTQVAKPKPKTKFG